MTLIKHGAYLLLFYMLICLSGCKQPVKEETATAPLPVQKVRIAQVVEEIAANQIEIVGTVQAVDRAEISAKIAGNILSIPVDLGSRVNKGDLLIKLSAGEISAQVQQAGAQLEQAKRNLAREEKLLQQQAATTKTVKSLRDTVRIAQAAFLESQTMLDYAIINAPFSGIVTQKMANVGDLATPGKPLLRIEGEKTFEILTDIPESLIDGIHQKEELTVRIPAIHTTVTGEVSEISPTADPSSRTVPIKIKIGDKPNIRSGQFARVALPLEKTQTLVVPENAVLAYGQMDLVFVAEDNKAQLRIVRTGSRQKKADGSRSLEILSGLAAGETVIISGNENLHAGQPLVIE